MNMRTAITLLWLTTAGILLSCAHGQEPRDPSTATTQDKVKLSDAEWRKKLGPQAYHVMREGGTERAFTGKWLHVKGSGTFVCAGCGHALFHTRNKFESGTGWPSFYKPIERSAVIEKNDMKLGMMRTEVVCSRCEGHLGHVFEDGPKPTGLRYCINSVSLDYHQDVP